MHRVSDFEVAKHSREVSLAMDSLSRDLERLDGEIDALHQRLVGEVERRREAEAELRASEQRHRDFADCAGDWFWETDDALRLSYVSDRFAAATGRAADTVLGKTLYEITTREHLAGEGEDWRAHFEDLAHRRAFSHVEMPIPAAGDRTIHALLAGKPVFDTEGRFVGYRGAARDITAYKETETKLEQQSSYDALTGIANRRRLDDFLEHEWYSAERSGTLLAVILADVDAFKAFNDHYGHGAGDECLSAIAATLDRALRRKVDLAARYGGEEFCCVLPGTDLAGATAVAERLRRDVEELQIPHEHSETAPHVTISLGVAATKPESQMEPSTLVSKADAHLYAAKRSGRNRVVHTAESAQVVSLDRSKGR